MSSLLFARRRQLTLLAAVSSCLMLASGTSFANEKVCRLLEQRYEQIEKGASSIEINATLFSAADKGCKELAQHLLDAGASLEAETALAFSPWAGRRRPGKARWLLCSLRVAHQSTHAPSTVLLRSIKRPRQGGCLSFVNWSSTARTCAFPGVAAFRRSPPAPTWAASRSSELLIEKGADPNATDSTEKTAITYAAGRGFPEIVACFSTMASTSTPTTAMTSPA